MRKLLMTVLALALILGSISVASAASGKVKLTDIADNTNEEAIQVDYDLGIVTGTPEGAYEPEKAVNRAEFAALIVRALAIPESALATYTTTTFKDTSGYGWAVPYLAILQQKGIMKGDGYGNVMPGRTINPNEAVTMVLRAIGYTDNASVLVGQWPANYVSLGQSLNLYEKVSTDLQMNKASAAQMIYNVLTAQLVQVDANSTVKLVYDSDGVGRQNLLTTGLNCYADPDTATRKVVTYGDAASSKINLTEKVGAYGILYRSKADDEVVALTEVETVFLAGKFTYVDGSDSDNDIYIGRVDKFQTVDGTKYNLDARAKNAVKNLFTTTSAVSSVEYGSFVNGTDSRSVGAYTARYRASGDYNWYSDQSIKDYTTRNGDKRPKGNESKLIVAAKVSGVTILELRSVAVWDAEISKQGDYFLYESGQIDGTKFNGHDFPLDVNNERDDYGYALAGVNSLDELAADNVVYIYKNEDKKIARIEVGTETQSGVITNINDTDSQRTIGGKVIGDSPYHHNTWNDLQYVNNEGTALLDVWGRTFAFHLGDASKGTFAVYLADQINFKALQSKLFDNTGKEVVYGVKDEIKFNGTKRHSVSPDGKSRGEFLTGLDGKPIVEYKLSNGNISELRVGSSATNSLQKSNVNKAGTIIKITGSGSSDGDYRLDSNTLVYVDGGNDEYSIGSIKDLLDRDLEEPFRFITDSNDPKLIRAMVVRSADAGANDIYIMINSATKGSDGAGGIIDVFNGLSFDDGVSATAKSWSHKDSEFIDRGAYGRQPVPYKFRIGEDGILKGGTDLGHFSLYDTNKDGRLNGDEVNPTTSASIRIGEKNAEGNDIVWYSAGSGGTFTLLTSNGYLTFESNTVLYKVDGSKWTAVRPTEGNFKADAAGSTYTFYKTDTKKAYNIIVLN
jgi:hypothetical protein